MALSLPGLAVMKLNDSSRRNEISKQSILNFKPSFKYNVSNPVSRNPRSRTFLESSKSDSLGTMATATAVFDSKPDREIDGGDDGNMIPPGNGGGRGGDSGGGRGGDSSGGDEDDYYEEEFGPLMTLDEVMKVAESNGVPLPEDMLKAAKAKGLRELVLTRYLYLQKSGWVLGFLTRTSPVLRNRLLADPSFSLTEKMIESCCATFAEVKKRGKDFWNEFELYAADLLVGIVVNIALVGMLTPYARAGKETVATGVSFGAVASFSSSVFEFARPGCKFSAQQRLATYFYKGLLYGSVGFGSGLLGQGITNMIMNAKRSLGMRYSLKCAGITASTENNLHSLNPPGVPYGSVGFGCGLIGQGIANMIMNAKCVIQLEKTSDLRYSLKCASRRPPMDRTG